MSNDVRDRRVGSALPQAALTALFVAALLAGCSKSEEPVVPSGGAAASKSVAKAGPEADLVAAVSTGTDPAVANLRFELQERPAVGTPFHLHLVVSPLQDVDKLQLTFEVTPGLELTDASPFFQLAKVAAGEKQSHVLGVRATREGVFEVHAIVTAEAALGAATSTSTYSIPVLVIPAAAPPK
jgi:hypothetical protein